MAIERDIREIKEAFKRATTNTPRTWAQMAAQAKDSGPKPTTDNTKTERLEKIKRERAKTEVTLTTRNASEKMKKQIGEKVLRNKLCCIFVGFRLDSP